MLSDDPTFILITYKTYVHWVQIRRNVQISILFHQTIFFTLSQTKHFKLFQIETVCRQQFLNLMKWQRLLQKGRKQFGKRSDWSLWAISPFPTVFSRLVMHTCKTRACLGKWPRTLSFCLQLFINFKVTQLLIG